MPTRLRLCVLSVVAAIAVSLLAFTPQSASATDGDMSIERAGRYYLDTVCPANRSEDKFEAKHQGTKNPAKWKTTYYKNYKGKVLKRTRRAAPAAYNGAYKAARRLANPPAPWPAGIADRVQRVSDGYLDASDQYDRVENKPRSKSWDALLKIDEIGTRSARESKRVRSFLDLPSNGRGC
jgi:hypothetical protein